MISACGITWPTVAQRFSKVSSERTCVVTGDVSVMPNAIDISLMPMSPATCFITSIGQGEPAMIPVRSELRSYWLKSGCPSWAMNIVGTP